MMSVQTKYVHIKKQLCEVQQVMTIFGVVLFRPVEIFYIKEYVKVMWPVVGGLDYLQGEKTSAWSFFFQKLLSCNVSCNQIKMIEI